MSPQEWPRSILARLLNKVYIQGSGDGWKLKFFGGSGLRPCDLRLVGFSAISLKCDARQRVETFLRVEEVEKCWTEREHLPNRQWPMAFSFQFQLRNSEIGDTLIENKNQGLPSRTFAFPSSFLFLWSFFSCLLSERQSHHLTHPLPPSTLQHFSIRQRQNNLRRVQ